MSTLSYGELTTALTALAEKSSWVDVLRAALWAAERADAAHCYFLAIGTMADLKDEVVPRLSPGQQQRYQAMYEEDQHGVIVHAFESAYEDVDPYLEITLHLEDTLI